MILESKNHCINDYYWACQTIGYMRYTYQLISLLGNTTIRSRSTRGSPIELQVRSHGTSLPTGSSGTLFGGTFGVIYCSDSLNLVEVVSLKFV